jgi:hypothetical protein
MFNGLRSDFNLQELSLDAIGSLTYQGKPLANVSKITLRKATEADVSVYEGISSNTFNDLDVQNEWNSMFPHVPISIATQLIVTAWQRKGGTSYVDWITVLNGELFVPVLYLLKIVRILELNHDKVYSVTDTQDIVIDIPDTVSSNTPDYANRVTAKVTMTSTNSQPINESTLRTGIHNWMMSDHVKESTDFHMGKQPSVLVLRNKGGWTANRGEPMVQIDTFDSAIKMVSHDALQHIIPGTLPDGVSNHSTYVNNKNFALFLEEINYSDEHSCDKMFSGQYLVMLHGHTMSKITGAKATVQLPVGNVKSNITSYEMYFNTNAESTKARVGSVTIVDVSKISFATQLLDEYELQYQVDPGSNHTAGFEELSYMDDYTGNFYALNITGRSKSNVVNFKMTPKLVIKPIFPEASNEDAPIDWDKLSAIENSIYNGTAAEYPLPELIELEPDEIAKLNRITQYMCNQFTEAELFNVLTANANQMVNDLSCVLQYVMTYDKTDAQLTGGIDVDVLLDTIMPFDNSENMALIVNDINTMREIMGLPQPVRYDWSVLMDTLRNWEKFDSTTGSGNPNDFYPEHATAVLDDIVSQIAPDINSNAVRAAMLTVLGSGVLADVSIDSAADRFRDNMELIVDSLNEQLDDSDLVKRVLKKYSLANSSAYTSVYNLLATGNVGKLDVDSENIDVSKLMYDVVKADVLSVASAAQINETSTDAEVEMAMKSLFVSGGSVIFPSQSGFTLALNNVASQLVMAINQTPNAINYAINVLAGTIYGVIQIGLNLFKKVSNVFSYVSRYVRTTFMDGQSLAYNTRGTMDVIDIPVYSGRLSLNAFYWADRSLCGRLNSFILPLGPTNRMVLTAIPGVSSEAHYGLYLGMTNRCQTPTDIKATGGTALTISDQGTKISGRLTKGNNLNFKITVKPNVRYTVTFLDVEGKEFMWNANLGSDSGAKLYTENQVCADNKISFALDETRFNNTNEMTVTIRLHATNASNFTIYNLTAMSDESGTAVDDQVAVQQMVENFSMMLHVCNALVEVYNDGNETLSLKLDDKTLAANTVYGKLMEIKKKAQTDVVTNACADIAVQTAAGAAVGAAIGTVVPGIGTAIGAVVGGAIGLFSGLFSNSKKETAEVAVQDSINNQISSADMYNLINSFEDHVDPMIEGNMVNLSLYFDTVIQMLTCTGAMKQILTDLDMNSFNPGIERRVFPCYTITPSMAYTIKTNEMLRDEFNNRILKIGGAMVLIAAAPLILKLGKVIAKSGWNFAISKFNKKRQARLIAKTVEGQVADENNAIIQALADNGNVFASLVNGIAQATSVSNGTVAAALIKTLYRGEITVNTPNPQPPIR